MKNATALTTLEWLGLTDGSARDIFPGSAAEIQSLYRKLVQRWHPDRNPDPKAPDVFIRIQSLYAVATGSRAPASAAVFELKDHEGRLFRFQGTAQAPFELGQWGRGAQTLAYRVSPDNLDLFDNAVARIRTLGFASDAMRQAMAPVLPTLAGAPKGPEGGLLVLKHAPEAIRLRDLYEHTKDAQGSMDPLHVAWIVSNLLNLACYLEHQQLAHHAIDLDSLWVVPERHEVALLGGWFYAKRFGDALSALPTSSLNMASAAYLSNKTAAQGFDLELIRAVGRELLGDRRGQHLADKHGHKPFVRFLQLPSKNNAVDDYRHWKEVLQASFGPPKFVPMTVSVSHVYKENHHG